MARVRLDMPAHYPFECSIPIRITDLNYGGHAGNDRILALAHEARVQYLAHYGYTEMEMEGIGLIMADAAIEYKTELFYGDRLFAKVSPANFTRVGFDLFYKLEKETASGRVAVALIKTGMIGYNYPAKKIANIPALVKQRLSFHQE